MFLSFRELKHGRVRYLLIAAIIAMIAWLVFLLSGLANGLANDNASAVINMPADYLVFQADAKLLLHRSVLAGDIVEKVRQMPGVKAATGLGQLTVTTARLDTGKQIDAAILAVDSQSFLAPKLSEGKNFGEGGGVVVDQHFQKQGLKVGDQLRVTSSGEILTISGFTNGQTYGHLPVIFMPISQWQNLKFGTSGAKGQPENPISAIAVQMDEKVAAEVAKALPNLEIGKREDVTANLPGYKEETGTITMIQAFLFLIAAFIIAVFFYVLTLQKINQFGILKALGATTKFLIKDLMIQVLFLSLVGVLVGALFTFGVAAIIPAGVPFALEGSLVLGYGLVLLVVALVGTLLSLQQIAKTDALTAISRQF